MSAIPRIATKFCRVAEYRDGPGTEVEDYGWRSHPLITRPLTGSLRSRLSIAAETAFADSSYDCRGARLASAGGRHSPLGVILVGLRISR